MRTVIINFMDKPSANTNTSSGNAHTTAERPRFNSAVLLGGAREVIIEHAGEEYRLRLTNQGKLILTK